MSLRTRVVLYVVALHAALAVLAVMAADGRPVWLFVAEAAIVVSAIAATILVRALFLPMQIVRTGAELIDERSFGTRFREVGQADMDALVGIYNRMADQLREERLRLEESNLLLERILETSPGGVVILDHDGRIASANPAACRLLGTPLEGLVGTSPSREGAGGLGVAAGDAGNVSEAGIVHLADGRRIRRVPGTFFDRGFRRTFYLLDDITPELTASETAAYEKLIRMMSHEVRNTVGAVRSLLESLAPSAEAMPEGEREDFRYALDVASRRLTRLHGFMEGLADVVRLPPPEPEPCDLGALLRDLGTLLEADLARRRIALDLAIAGDLPTVELDKNQIERVLVNVLKNAIEAIGSDGRLRVRAGTDTRVPWISIHDSGPGIDDEARARLFTPFFSTKRGGQGVGLTLAREVLDRHGFPFSLDDHPDGGAEFRVRFDPVRSDLGGRRHERGPNAGPGRETPNASVPGSSDPAEAP